MERKRLKVDMEEKKTAPETEETVDTEEKSRAEAGTAPEDAAPVNGEAAPEEEAEKAEGPEAPAEEEASEEEPEEKEEKEGFLGRMSRKEKKLKREIEKKDAEIAAAADSYKRLMAEFDNYRKRTEKEKAAAYDIGAREVIEKILPVVDNFERGLSLVEEDDKEDPFTVGMEKIYKQLETVLSDLGVKPIEAVGQPFDPNLHNAVMHLEDESLGENVVAQEFQKGYTYKDQVVRHSMVQVAN